MAIQTTDEQEVTTDDPPFVINSVSHTSTSIAVNVPREPGYRYYCLECVDSGHAPLRRKQYTVPLPVDEQPATIAIEITGLTPSTAYMIRAREQDTGAFTDL